MDLTIEVSEGGTLALLGFDPVAGAPPGPLQVPPSGPRRSLFDLRGAFVDYPARAPRITLLNHMWRTSPGAEWLWLGLAAGIGLGVAGCLSFPVRALAIDADRPRAVAIWTSAAAAALLAGSLGVTYAVLVPPLTAPDEPYHLLGFAELAADRALAEDTVRWMGETHLWRIRYQPTEHFRTIDVGQPYVVEDDQLQPTEVAMRSAVLARLWETVTPFLVGEPAPRVLFALRLLNALVFALAVGAATAFAAATVPEPFPQWLGFPFLFVSSLPFFAMHVSETALLCSIYVILATSLAALFLDGPRTAWAGAPLGLATGLMLAGGRSPWPLAGLVALALLGRVLLGTRGAPNAPRQALSFWGGFAAGAAVFFALESDAYRAMRTTWAYHFTGSFPSWLRSGAEWLLAHPAAAAGLVGVGAACEIALQRPREWLAARLGVRMQGLVRRTALTLVGLVLISLAGSLFLDYPQLDLEPKRALAAAERVAAVLATTGTMFRLREPNFLLSSSFWGGFGWLDTMPGPAFQAVLVALVACALVLLLRHVARHEQARRLLWLVILGVGGAVALVLYTLSTQSLPKALHGRYLIGWYLCLLSVIGTALALDLRSGGPGSTAAPPSGTVRAAVALVVAGSIHTYCLFFILRRYF
jgi:hypothetical protein